MKDFLKFWFTSFYLITIFVAFGILFTKFIQVFKNVVMYFIETNNQFAIVMLLIVVASFIYAVIIELSKYIYRNGVK